MPKYWVDYSDTDEKIEADGYRDAVGGGIEWVDFYRLGGPGEPEVLVARRRAMSIRAIDLIEGDAEGPTRT